MFLLGLYLFVLDTECQIGCLLSLIALGRAEMVGDARDLYCLLCLDGWRECHEGPGGGRRRALLS